MWRVLVLTIFGAFAETIFCVEDNFRPLPFPFWASSLFPTTTSCIYTKRATCCLLPRSTNSVHWLLFFFSFFLFCSAQVLSNRLHIHARLHLLHTNTARTALGRLISLAPARMSSSVVALGPYRSYRISIIYK